MYLTDEQKRKYIVMSRANCERYCIQKHSNTSIIVSIKSSWDKELSHLCKTKDNKVKAILFLSFDDIDKEDDPRFAMKLEDGEKIATFVNKYYKKVDRIIVHCDGGISRSAGVASAIMRVKEGNDYPIFDSSTKHPNMTCYLQTLKCFNYILYICFK